MKETIAIFSSHYLPHLGGVERYVYNLAKGLTKQGYRVIIVTSNTDGNLGYEDKEEATVFRLPSFKFMNGRFPILKTNKETKNVIQRLDTYNIKYAVVNTRFYWLSVFAGKFAKKREIPCILIEHGTGHINFDNKIVSFCGEIYEHAITRIIKKYINTYYGVSWACVQWLEHFNIKAEGVLYNAIDLEEIQRLRENKSDKIKDFIQYSASDKIITYTGRLIKEKGVLKLIDAMKVVGKNFPEAKLCIAGDGELCELLKSNKKENIYLLGKLDFEDVVQLLNITTVYCLPTDYPEGLPTSVLEAIACNNYIITTTSGGAKEIIKNEKSGTILEENSVCKIAKAIEEALQDEKITQQKVKKAFDRLVEEFTWEKTVEKLIEIINS